MNWSRVTLVPVTACLVVLSSGCAAMFSGTNETIHLRSEEPGTRFYANEVDLGSGTSAIATLRKNQLKSMILRATKEGCDDRVSPVATAFDPVTLLGLFLDLGIVSIFVVDFAATGAVTKASQTSYVLTPTCHRLTGQSLLGPASDAEVRLKTIMEEQR